jgi:hypothetical protein
MHDTTIFRGAKNAETEDEDCDPNALAYTLDFERGQRFVADDALSSVRGKVVTSREEHSPEYREFIARIKNRQETLFKRMKDFDVLEERFGYGATSLQRREMHKLCVDACAVIVQYDFENGHPPFDVC